MLRPATRLAASLALACALAPGTANALVVDGGVDNTFAISTYDQTVWAWGGNVGGKLGNGSTMNTSMPVPVKESWTGRMALGFFHTCTWNHYGAASCWGQNTNGQLGNGFLVNQFKPVGVVGLESGVAQMTAGTFHTCALMETGGVKCWGSNFYKNLGTGFDYDSFTPEDVIGLSTGVAAIAAGEKHTCALTTQGGVKCWGTNGNGQLGVGDMATYPTPIAIPSLASGVSAITAGAYHTCALSVAGEVKCWGHNLYGQLGINSQTDSLQPASVSALGSGVLSISAGSYHTCAITSTGAAKCWGENASGEAGIGSAGAPVLLPANVSGLSAAGSVLAIKVGFHHTCALTSNRQILCWGANTRGELGDSSTTPHLLPTPTWYLGANVVSLESGGQHNCAVYRYPSGLNVGLCWGRNTEGGVGNDTMVDQLYPVSYSNYGFDQPLEATAVSAGMSHTLAIKYDGTVWAWGANNRGQLGVGRNAAQESCFTPFDGTIDCSTTAVRVPGLTGIVAVGAGWGHSLALKGDDGSVWAWGDNQFGQLGSGAFATSYTPRRVQRYDFPTGNNVSLTGVSQIAAGYFHNVALLEFDGKLVAWGRNNRSQLGIGDGFSGGDWAAAFPVLTPSGVALSGASAISSKGSHTLALVGGQVFAWGLNSYGQVGNGSTSDVPAPVPVQSNVFEISAGMTTSMTRRFNSSAYAWGLNTHGQLGTSSSGSCASFLPCAAEPKQISQFSTPQGIAAAGAHGVVIRNDGIVAMFGDNSSGQLADRSGNFPDVFDQDRFDPLGLMTPLLVVPTGTSISRTTSGTGISLDTLGASIDFGKNAVNSDSSIELPIENLDPTAITFSSINVTGDGFRLPDPPIGCSPAVTLPQFGTCSITLYYKPINADTHYGTLEILSNAVDNSVLTFGLTGTGIEAPTAPSSLTAAAGDQSAVVTFNPPSFNGGASIVSYAVTASNGAVGYGTDYVNGIAVAGLANGTAYTFTATATNSFGLTSLPSAPSNSVTPRTAPSSNVVTSSLNPSPYQAAVTFTATVAGTAGTPTGTIAFRDGANLIAGCEAVTLSSGSAQCSTSTLAVGTRSITAQYSGNVTTYSGSTSSALLQAVQPALVGVFLGTSHGEAGYMQVTVDTSQPLGGAVTVDPRTGFNDGSRTLFFNFNSGYSTALVTTTTGQVTTYSYGPTGVGMIVEVPDNTRFTVTLNNINGTSQTVSASMAFLVGDANSSRSVTSADIDVIKSHAGEGTTAGNFRHDVNRSGAITAADILAAKGRLNLVVP